YLCNTVIANPIRRYNIFIQIKQWDDIFQQTFGDDLNDRKFVMGKKSRSTWLNGKFQSFINDHYRLRTLCRGFEFSIRSIPITGTILAILFFIFIIFDYSIVHFVV
ncbi:hypothetical protein BLA29_008687, partial [Euroglyphus maynei]